MTRAQSSANEASASTPADTGTSFREAYAVLQHNANLLRQQSEPNIDELLDIVTRSVAAYRTCQTRIDAVEAALEQALGQMDADNNNPS